jgi:phosphate transport system protein
MPTTPQGFSDRLAGLKATLVEQGQRVQKLLEDAFEATFARDAAAAARVVERDDEIDRVDVEVERAAVQLLTDATHEGAQLDAHQLRTVLTIVKINNELERIADGAVTIAERAQTIAHLQSDIPGTFRVMANSVVGILRDTHRAFERSDTALAKVVLQSEHTVEVFKAAILQEAERRIASGETPVEVAFSLHEIANECCRMADHCTNIAEQVIYLVSGAIVRHTDGKWVEVTKIV